MFIFFTSNSNIFLLLILYHLFCVTAHDKALYKYFFFFISSCLSFSAPTTNAPPRMSYSPRQEVTVVAGETLTLECVVEGSPVPVVTWDKYGGRLPSQRIRTVLGTYSGTTYISEECNDIINWLIGGIRTLLRRVSVWLKIWTKKKEAFLQDFECPLEPGNCITVSSSFLHSLLVTRKYIVNIF